MQNDNQLTSLPNGVFAGLTSLQCIGLVRMQPLQLGTESLTEPLEGVCGAASSCLAALPYRTRLAAFSVLVCLAFAFPALVSFGLLPACATASLSSHLIQSTALAGGDGGVAVGSARLHAGSAPLFIAAVRYAAAVRVFARPGIRVRSRLHLAHRSPLPVARSPTPLARPALARMVPQLARLYPSCCARL